MKPLTREFLLSQGKCCKNNCKNCPWKRNKNMENKYYTPDTSDLRVGYEAEISHIDSDIWIPTKWRHNEEVLSTITNLLNYNRRIRTPFLTKEQIENEGWKFNEVEIVKPNLMCYKKGTMHGDEVLYQIIYILSTKWILIYVGNYIIRTTLNNNEIITNNTLFSGKCLSINEFRYICKLLNIK